MGQDEVTRRPAGRSTPLFQSISVRLFVWLFAVTIAAFAAYAWFSVRSASTQWEQAVDAGAQQFSDLIKSSTHYAMLLNRKQDVHHTIRMIAAEPGVENVRIYNKSGEIIFSANAGEIGQRVDLMGEACVSCHNSTTPLQSVPEGSRTRIFRRASGARVLGLINPIQNAPECYNASCHAHPPEQSILGVLDVTVSMVESDARLAVLRRQALVAAVLTALLAGLCSALFILRVVRRPVKRLIAGAERVAGGRLDTVIAVQGRNEIGQLAGAFNEMTGELKQARRELTNWSVRLERRLREKTAELQRSQREVTHMEKMASLGKLAATVAHELNNPLAGILTYAKLIARTLDEIPGELEQRAEIARSLQLIQREAARSGDIVRNLLVFARRSGAELAEHSFNPILERAAMLVRHHLEMASIRLELCPVEGDDRLICDADQIQQALVALLVNGVEAMPGGGTLTVAGEGREDDIVLSVGDTGVGIPADDLPRIFEPFFSSKEESSGAGLGLAVVYGIVQRHGAKIDVQSEVDRGTTFRIVLPRRTGGREAAPRTVGAVVAAGE